MTKPKLSLFLYSLASGGAERVASIITNNLQDKFDITLVLMNKRVDYKLPNNQKIIYLEQSDPMENALKKLFKLFLLAFRYKKLCNENSFDISFSLMNRPNIINIVSKILGNRSKTVISERAMPSIEYGYKNLQSFVMKLLIKLFYNRADIITCNSCKNRLDLIKNFAITKEITVLYNPLDLDLIDTKKMEICEQKNYFVTVGRLDRGKNHKFLIENFRSYATDDEKLLIIGDGVLKEYLLDLIRSHGLEEKIFLLGYEKNPFRYLYHAKAFLFSSLHEGLANVLLESLACNTPVVSFANVSSEILQTDPKADYMRSDFGIAVSDTEGFIKAVKSLKNYTFTPRKRAEDFALSKTVDAFKQVLNS